MNRKQAEHLLEAYVQMTYIADARGMEYTTKAADDLREVILDAMTEYRVSTVPIYPNITLPYRHFTNPTYKPIVTCNTNTGVVEE